MAIARLYLSTADAEYTPATIRGAWDDTAGAVTKSLAHGPRGVGAATTVARAETNATTEYDVLLYRGVSGPLSAQTISGTLNAVISVRESATAANLHWHVHVYVTQGDSDTPRGTLLTDYREAAGTNEWSTSLVGRALSAAQALSSLAVSAGDRLVVELGYSARNTATTSYTGTLGYGANWQRDLAATENVLAAGYLVFSTALAFESESLTPTQVLIETLDASSAEVDLTHAIIEVLSPLGVDARVTHVTVETLDARTAPAWLTHVVVEVLGTLPLYTEGRPTGGEGLCGKTRLHRWIEWAIGGATRYLADAKHDPLGLDDPSSYYGGYKAPRILTFGEAERSLSDRSGQWVGATFRAVLADTDHAVRGWLAAATHIRDTEIVARMVSAVGRAARVLPRVLYRGPLASWRPTDDLTVELTGGDAVQALLGVGSQERQLPQRRIDLAHFPGAPEAAIGRAEPIIYGHVTSALSDVTPPTLDGDPARGAFVDGGTQVFGWGNLTSACDPPTGVALTEGTGSIDSGEGPSGGSTYYGWVTSVDATGAETDPDTFNTRDTGAVASVTISGTGKGLVFNWTAPGAGDAPTFYRAYLAWDYFGTRVIQRLQVAGGLTTCTFDDCPTFTQWGLADWSELATGAVGNPYSAFADYAVSAVVNGYETALSVIGKGHTEGYRRPVRVEWEELPVTASEYRVYRRDYAGAPWNRRWTVPVVGSPATLHLDDDWLDTGVTFIDDAPRATGAVPVIYTGVERLTVPSDPTDPDAEVWYRFLVAGHALKAIEAWYYDGVLEDVGTAGVDYLIPGQTGWTERFGTALYREFNGRRCTVIYARGPKGDALAGVATGSPPTVTSATLTLDVQGIEDAADGTGALIASFGYAYVHFLVNFVLQNYLTGAWLPNPEWESGWAKIHGARFHAVDTETPNRITGGYVVRAYIADLKSARDRIAEWNLCGDVRLGQNSDWQWEIHLLPEAVSLGDCALFVDGLDVLHGSLDITPEPERLATRQPYRWDYRWPEARWGGESTLIADGTVETRHGEITAPSLDLPLVGSAVQALDVATRIHARLLEKEPQAIAFLTDQCGHRVDVGDILRLRHFAGTTATGFHDRLIQVARMRDHPDLSVTIAGPDVSAQVGVTSP